MTNFAFQNFVFYLLFIQSKNDNIMRKENEFNERVVISAYILFCYVNVKCRDFQSIKRFAYLETNKP